MKIPPFPAFLVFMTALLVAIGWVWIPLPPSNEELVGYAGKLDYLIDLVREEGSIPWWIPGYLSGYSGAAVLSYALGLAPFAIGSLFLETVTAFKVVGLILMGAGGIAAYTLGRKLASSGWAGFATGAMFLLSPQILMRLGWLEHMTIVATYPLVPLCFLALFRVANTGSRLDAQFLGMAFSATLLCWPKIGATLVVPLALFGIWLFTKSNSRANLVRGFLWAAPITFLLGVLPLLPLVRESRFMTIFELGPFEGWQSAFSVRTATSWFDRGGDLFSGMPAALQVSRGGYYLGLLPMACLAAVMVRTWRAVAEEDQRLVSTIKAFVGTTMTIFWLSFGPRNVIEGHFQFLEHAQELADWVLPVHWLVLGAQAAVIWWLIPGGPSKRIFFVGALVVYFLVPGFRWIEWIPLFRDIRAPDSFWILGGTVPWCVAGGLAVYSVIRRARGPALRTILVPLALAIALAEATPYLRRFSEGSMDAELYRDFAESQKFLRDRPLPGRVLAVSGRYFYLQVPALSGRGLVTEAAHLNFMARDAARLHSAAWKSAPAMAAYGNLAGVSHVLIDKTDPGSTAEMRQWLRSIWPAVFENDHFLILENSSPLYPAFAGPGTDIEHPPEVDDSTHALIMSTYDSLVLPPGVPAPASSDAKKLRLVKEDENGKKTSSLRAFAIPATADWVVLNEAWHPDWQATVNGDTTEVHRVAAAFPAILAPEGGEVIFRFMPPWWYSACILVALLAWIVALVSIPFQIRGWRRVDAALSDA